MLGVSKLIVRSLVIDLPSDAFDYSPADHADYIAQGVGHYLRYLRHLRAKWGGWADRVSSIQYRASGGRVGYTPPPWTGFPGNGTS
jgi:hypothetical protein